MHLFVQDPMDLEQYVQDEVYAEGELLFLKYSCF